MRWIFVLLLPFILNSCQTISGWADSLGEHMPVVGERCEHWQCFTSSGQKKNETIEQEKDSSYPTPALKTPPASEQNKPAEESPGGM